MTRCWETIFSVVERLRHAQTEVIQRAAYQSIHFTGATPAHPDGDPKAKQEVAGVLDELLAVFPTQQQAA
ncbi:hypothetical protein [Methylobacterium sp. WSM2598]|uniref:hypothetical protein n=1 Tax=Methylobacterium sp. WSM2598 TaxID=398261 RepID=UPI000380F6F8|nr:hypothetical protein [Methylobacterium sp. WSM2598]